MNLNKQKNKKINEIDNEEKSRENYKTHVVVLKNNLFVKIRDKESKSYFDAVKSTTGDEKKMLLQHMFTYKQESKSSAFLYNAYRNMVLLDVLIENIEQETRRVYNLMKEEISSLGFENQRSANWIQITILDIAFGIYHDSKSIAENYNQRNDLEIKYDSKKNEYIIGVQYNPFAGSKSKETVYKLKECIVKHTKNMNDLVREIKNNKKILLTKSEKFDKQFEDAMTSHDNKFANFGGCYHCFQWIQDDKREEYKRLISNRFTLDRVAWEERLWDSEDVLH